MFFRPRTTRIPFAANGRKRKLGRRLERIEFDLANDRHARAAIEAYADACAIDMPWLAEVLHQSAAQGAVEPSACVATVRRVFGLAHDWAATQPDYARGAWEHVQIHLEAALTRRLKPSQDDGHPAHGTDDFDSTGAD